MSNGQLTKAEMDQVIRSIAANLERLATSFEKYVDATIGDTYGTIRDEEVRFD